jgi:hypothetical protein
MAHRVVHLNGICRNVVACHRIRVTNCLSRGTGFGCLVPGVSTIKNFRQIEMDINAVQNYLYKKYMDLRVLVILPFLVRLNTIHYNNQIDGV